VGLRFHYSPGNQSETKLSAYGAIVKARRGGDDTIVNSVPTPSSSTSYLDAVPATRLRRSVAAAHRHKIRLQLMLSSFPRHSF
jgi:hypothetical protein